MRQKQERLARSWRWWQCRMLQRQQTQSEAKWCHNSCSSAGRRLHWGKNKRRRDCRSCRRVSGTATKEKAGPRGSWRGAIGCRRQAWKHVCVCVCGCGCGCDSFPSPEFIIKHKCAQFSSHETCLLTWPLLTKSEIFIFALKVCLGY